MNKRYEKIELGGKRFTLDTKREKGYTPIVSCTIYDAYKRPSTTKCSIWHEWYEWFLHNNGWCCISSHNSNFFSIQGYVRNSETQQLYFCYITYANNYCVKVNE